MENIEITVALIAATVSIIVAIVNAISNWKNQKEIEHLKASIDRQKRLDIRRQYGYENIWKITGALNLFGPESKPDIKTISAQLYNWYFQYGMVLKSTSKDYYFAIQEMLNFGILRSINFVRPNGEELYAGQKRTKDIIEKIRLEKLGIKITNMSPKELDKKISEWKTANPIKKEQSETNWVLLQYTMSKFRTNMIKDLGY